MALRTWDCRCAGACSRIGPPGRENLRGPPPRHMSRETVVGTRGWWWNGRGARKARATMRGNGRLPYGRASDGLIVARSASRASGGGGPERPRRKARRALGCYWSRRLKVPQPRPVRPPAKPRCTRAFGRSGRAVGQRGRGRAAWRTGRTPFAGSDVPPPSAPNPAPKTLHCGFTSISASGTRRDGGRCVDMTVCLRELQRWNSLVFRAIF